MPKLLRIFIHGGSHGAWCWDTVLELLADNPVDGEKNIAFDLPGCGDDLTPRQEVTLRMDVDRILEVMDGYPGVPVELVGHSIAGWLLPEIAMARPYRVVSLRYIAAATLHAGQRGIDVMPPDKQQLFFDMAGQSEDFTVLASFESARRRFYYHLTDEEAFAAYQRCTRQPFQVYLDPVEFGPRDVHCPIHYLALDEDFTFDIPTATRFAHTASVEPIIKPGDHCIMLSNPACVVEFVRGEYDGVAPWQTEVADR